jgi:hypothetical protein
MQPMPLACATSPVPVIDRDRCASTPVASRYLKRAGAFAETPLHRRTNWREQRDEWHRWNNRGGDRRLR